MTEDIWKIPRLKLMRSRLCDCKRIAHFLELILVEYAIDDLIKDIDHIIENPEES